MPRQYDDEDFARAVTAFGAWTLALGGAGLSALLKALRRPGEYKPVGPDDPTQEAPLDRFLKSRPTVDFSKAKLPKFSLSDGSPSVAWPEGDRPRLVAPGEGALTPAPEPTPLSAATAYRIAAPQAEPDYPAATQLVRALLASCPRLTFEIVAEGGGTAWQVVDPETQYPAAILVDGVKTYAPGAQVTPVPPGKARQRRTPFHRQLLLFGLTNEYAAPLPFLEMLKDRDPLRAVAGRLDLVQDENEERVVYALQARVVAHEALDRATRRLVGGTVKPTSRIYWQRKDDPLSGLDEKLLNAKLAGPLYHCFLSVTVESRREARLEELAQVARDVAAFTLAGHNGLAAANALTVRNKVTSAAEAAVPWLDALLAALLQAGNPAWRDLLLVLCPAEVAALWHLPDATFAAQRIAWAAPAAPAALTAGDMGERMCLGEAGRGGEAAPVYLAPGDRALHAAVTGKTGTGKSTLLHTLAHQDIAAGRGVAVIDPHGKLVDDILRTSIPENRVDDLVLLECGDAAYPVPLNLFRVPAGASYATTFNTLYWVLRKIYERIWHEGRMDVVLRNALQALLTDPEATPLDIPRLFGDARYREGVLKRMEQDANTSFSVAMFWRDFAGKSQGEKDQLAAPILSRSTAYLGQRPLEAMTCHPGAFNFQDFIRQKKIVLVNLSGEAIRSEVGSLGAIFLAAFTLASEALGYLPDGAEPRYYLYLDEIERMIASPLPDMFAHERKFGLALTLATQSLERLDREVGAGILANVGTHVLFESAEGEARALAPYVQPELDARALMNLGAYRAAVKTRAGGASVPAFVVNTLPPPEARSALPPEALRARSGAALGLLPAAEVRKWLAARYAPKKAPAKRKPRKRKGGTGADGLADFE